MGPVFGMKGGAAGGGYAQVVPMTDINLHFTGDFAAIAAAQQPARGADRQPRAPRQRARHRRPLGRLEAGASTSTTGRCATWWSGSAASSNGYPRQDGFDIVVASELMAIFCLTESWADLKRRIGDIVIGYTRAKKPVTARDLEAARRDGGAAARRARAQPGADPRARAGVRARRSVRQHRARLQLGDRDPGGAAAGRLRRHRGRLRRRPRRGEVRRHQVPQVRAAARTPRSWSRRCGR